MAADAPAFARELRRRLGAVAELPEWPLVSVVVPNRDGVQMLSRLLRGLIRHTDYPELELIVVDNASSDESVELLRRVEAPFPLSIVANAHNESFSDACNRGAELAAGEQLLFLNNDVEPFESGWLRELVACLRASESGAVSATLACPEEEHDASFRFGYGVQHRGLEFREEDGMLHPALHGWEADPFDDGLGRDVARGAVAAACLLVARAAFDRVGGFTHGYVYGGEDIDLCLKLRAAGFDVLCSGRSIAIHHPVSTRRKDPYERELARKLGNRRVLWERWGPRLRRAYELDARAGGGIWAAAAASATRDPGALGFCLKVAEPARAVGLERVQVELERLGHPSLLLEGECAEDPVGLNYDVAVCVGGGGRYVPKPGQFNVLWQVARTPASATPGRARYDLVLSGMTDDPQRFVCSLLERAGRPSVPRRDWPGDPG